MESENNLRAAQQSPRIENETIRWYCGDTFDLELHIDLTDQDGKAVNISSAGKVKVVFRDRSDAVVKTFECSGITNNTVKLPFNAATTALFGIGSYQYDIYLEDGKRTTIANDNKAVVE